MEAVENEKSLVALDGSKFKSIGYFFNLVGVKVIGLCITKGVFEKIFIAYYHRYA